MVSTVLVFLLSLLPVSAAPQSESGSEPCDSENARLFYVSNTGRDNNVTFESKAPLEDIVGTSGTISGSICFDPSRPESGSGELRVAVASLNTGIPLRDEHLRSTDWLDEKEHPFIEFRITDVTTVTPVKITDESQTYDVTVDGDMSVHGVTRSITVPARVTYLRESEATRSRMPGDLLAVRAEFHLRLADHDITGPGGKGLIGSKVGKTVKVTVSVIGSTAGADLLGGQ